VTITPVDQDLAIREAAIRHCRLLALKWGEAVPWSELARGFPFRDGWIKLVGIQGVSKPKELGDGALTLLSTLDPPQEPSRAVGP
jgi:putative restriction endonuclease